MKLRTLLVASSVLFTASIATAGRKDRWTVVVDTANRTAYGSLGSARNSPDSVQSIGCSTFYDPANRTNQVTCVATDARGTTATCASQDPNLVQISLAIGSDSFVQFWWDKGECTRLFVNNSSNLEPKQP